MSMEISSVNSSSESYSAAAVSKADTAVKAESTKENLAAVNDTAATLEKGQDSQNKATYSVNKMSPEDRANLIAKIKAENENRQSQLANIVSQLMSKQANAYGTATNMWEFLAKGDFEVDAATKAQAQADIAEDGYWGVKQTSQRMFDFASALAGDDVDKMKEMQEAMEKGYKMAEETWGRELPEISKQTMEAANKLFEDFYAAHA